jgi:uncharacterized membrane protein YhaH (DUF805 family)
MTRGQLAVVRSLWIVGALVLIIGIVMLIVDSSTVTETCTHQYGLRVCERESSPSRGWWIAGIGAVTLIATAVAWATLTPPENRPKPSGRKGGRGFLIFLGVLAVFVAAMAVLDVFVLS